MRLALIPARAGSKRVPGKNVRRFHGRPMIAHSIEAALRSASIERVWVSTDDAELARTARDLGAETPFLRPAEIADDHAPVGEAVAHAVREARAAGLDVTEVCLVYATAPLIEAVDIDRGHRTLLSSKADFALSVAPFRFAPQRGQRIGEGGRLSYVMPEHRLTRSQDLETVWHDAAQFVWGTAAAFAGELSDEPVTVAVPIEAERVIDIDAPEDWRFAERLFAALRGEYSDSPDSSRERG